MARLAQRFEIAPLIAQFWVLGALLFMVDFICWNQSISVLAPCAQGVHREECGTQLAPSAAGVERVAWRVIAFAVLFASAFRYDSIAAWLCTRSRHQCTLSVPVIAIV